MFFFKIEGRGSGRGSKCDKKSINLLVITHIGVRKLYLFYLIYFTRI